MINNFNQIRNEMSYSESNSTLLQHSHNTRANILVIDDDIEAVLYVDNVLKKFGCDISYAIESKDATKKITSGKLDLIILDWWVDKDTGAGIIEKSIKTIEKFYDLKQKVKEKHPKIITYSSLKEEKFIYRLHSTLNILIIGKSP